MEGGRLKVFAGDKIPRTAGSRDRDNNAAKVFRYFSNMLDKALDTDLSSI